MTSEYPSLSAFYAADHRRGPSGEADYGCWWMSGAHWPKYRVSYVRATGEVYAVQLGGDPVEVLGVVPPDHGPIYYQTLNRILDGWEEHCGSDLHGISWVQERLAIHGFALDPSGGGN